MAWSRVPPVQIPTDPAKLGYLAGLIDGEGCISVGVSYGKRTVNPSIHGYVGVSNCDYRIMEWLLENIGGRGIAKRTGLTRHKPVYHWQLRSENMERVLKAVLPYLVIKWERAELVLKLRALGLGKGGPGKRLDPQIVSARQEILAEIRQLNQRGVA